jgi:putative transposase
MKKSWFSHSLIIETLNCSEAGIMNTSMVARMKVLEIENARLKNVFAEKRLNAEILDEALTKKW